MRRFPNQEFAFGVLLTTAVFVACLALGFFREPAPPAKDAFSWSWYTKEAAGFFQFIMVPVAVAQVGLFFWQLRLMRETIDSSHEQLVSTQRAWVFVGISPRIAGDLDFIEFSLHAINYGQSPATVIEVRYAISDREPQSQDVPDQRYEIPFPLGPNRDLHSFQTISTFADQRIVYGHAVYLDAFGKRRESWFCYRIASISTGYAVRVAGGPEWHHFT